MPDYTPNPDAARRFLPQSYGVEAEEQRNLRIAENLQLLNRFELLQERSGTHWDPMFEECDDDWRIYGGDTLGPANRASRKRTKRPALDMNELPPHVRNIRIRELFKNVKISLEPRDLPGALSRPVGPFENAYINTRKNKQYTKAQVYQGLLNRIFYNTMFGADGQDIAFQTIVTGWGMFRGCVADESDDVMVEDGAKFSWDRKAVAERVNNPFLTYLDPDAEDPFYEDGAYAVHYSYISKAELAKRYGKERADRMEGGVYTHRSRALNASWYDQKSGLYTIAEFFLREEILEKVVLLRDPPGMDGSPGKEYNLPMKEFMEQREVLGMNGVHLAGVSRRKRMVVKRWVICGREVLEGPLVLPFCRIPFVPMPGDYFKVGGRKHYFGLVRQMKGPQKYLSLGLSTAAQITSMSPWQPVVYAKEGVEAQLPLWRNYASSMGFGLPYEYFDDDGNQIPGPIRIPPPEIPQSVPMFIAMMREGLSRSSGISPAALGQGKGGKTPESAQAVLAKQEASSLATEIFQQNFIGAIESLCRLFLPAFKHIYNRKRIVSIITDDGKTDEILINDDRVMMGPDGQKTFTLNSMRDDPMLDVRVSVDGNPMTDKMEFYTSLMDAVKGNQALNGFLLPEIVGNSSMAGSKRLRKLLRLEMTPEHLLEPEEIDEKLQGLERGLQYKEREAALIRQYQGDPPPNPEAEKDLSQAEKNRADANKTNLEAQGLMMDLMEHAGDASPEAQISRAEKLAKLQQIIMAGGHQQQMNDEKLAQEQMKTTAQLSKTQGADIDMTGKLVKNLNEAVLQPPGSAKQGAKPTTGGNTNA